MRREQTVDDTPRVAPVALDHPGGSMEMQDDAAVRRFLEAQIDAYNIATTGIPFGGHIVRVVRDAEAAIIAGLSGWIWGDWLQIESLWVREDQRGRGYGSILLESAEREARSRACRQAVLETHNFQAPDFYRKHGYTVFGALEDCPSGYATYYLRKALQ